MSLPKDTTAKQKISLISHYFIISSFPGNISRILLSLRLFYERPGENMQSRFLIGQVTGNIKIA